MRPELLAGTGRKRANRKVLLINPGFPTRPLRLIIPMGLLHLGTHLFHQGYEVNILEANNASHGRQFWDKLERELDDAVVVGLSVMTAQVASAVEIAAEVRRLAPAVPIIWGGVHATLYPEQVAGSSYADFAVRGDGEVTTTNLLAAIEQGANPAMVRGIAFKSESGVITTEAAEPVDIRKSPHPEWNLVADIREIGDMVEVARRTGVGLPIMTSRGCPHRCAFCINSVLDVQYRYRETGAVMEDIERILELGVTQISFFDEDLFANRKMLTEIIGEIERKKLKFRWFASARVDYFKEKHISPELLARIAASGCQQLGLGVESGSQRVLDRLKKDITVADTVTVARRLSDAGIDATFSFMAGMPGETEDDIVQTLRLATSISAINDTFRILGPFVYRPYPGSELYGQCLEQGMHEPASLEEWASSPYVGTEINPRDYHLFPWVQYPMKDLTRLIFYCWMSGLRLRYSFLTRIARRIGKWRCYHLQFGWPVELMVMRFLQKMRIDGLLSIGKFD